MNHSPDFAEQLSALMDGELPDAEARFLLRRLEHDAELRATWERMQLASQCLRAQPWQPVAAGFAERVAVAIQDTRPARAQRPLLRWAIAASVLALGLVMAPRLMQQPTAPAASALADAASTATAPAEAPSVPSEHLVPSPASADLVAMHLPATAASAPAAGSASLERGGSAPLVAAAEPSDRESPMPLDASTDAESPTDFPLVDNGGERSWPRSELVSSSSDPSIEAYLVRHNQMVASDGLGGFVPYVDVVSNAPPATNNGAQPAANDDAAAVPESDGQ
jgi:hypothetical protein